MSHLSLSSRKQFFAWYQPEQEKLSQYIDGLQVLITTLQEKEETAATLFTSAKLVVWAQ